MIHGSVMRVLLLFGLIVDHFIHVGKEGMNIIVS